MAAEAEATREAKAKVLRFSSPSSSSSPFFILYFSVSLQSCVLLVSAVAELVAVRPTERK